MSELTERLDKLANSKRQLRENTNKTWDDFVAKVRELRDYAVACGANIIESSLPPNDRDHGMALLIQRHYITIRMVGMHDGIKYQPGSGFLIKANYGSKEISEPPEELMKDVMDYFAEVLSYVEKAS